MIAIEDQDDDYEPDDDWYDDWYDDDPRDDWEPDPEDAEIARAYAEHAEHCERKHGGGECHCRPSLLDYLRWAAAGRIRRLRDLPFRVRIFAHELHTVRVGPIGLTARFRPPAQCGACRGEGWFYIKTGEPDLRPEGYDGVALCGCGSAVTKLAEDRRYVRQARNEPPF